MRTMLRRSPLPPLTLALTLAMAGFGGIVGAAPAFAQSAGDSEASSEDKIEIYSTMRENSRKLVCMTAPCGGLSDAMRRDAGPRLGYERYSEQCPGSIRIVYDIHETRVRAVCDRARLF
jgi:hypothetical protein